MLSLSDTHSYYILPKLRHETETFVLLRSRCYQRCTRSSNLVQRTAETAVRGMKNWRRILLLVAACSCLLVPSSARTGPGLQLLQVNGTANSTNSLPEPPVAVSATEDSSTNSSSDISAPSPWPASGNLARHQESCCTPSASPSPAPSPGPFRQQQGSQADNSTDTAGLNGNSGTTGTPSPAPRPGAQRLLHMSGRPQTIIMYYGGTVWYFNNDLLHSFALPEQRLQSLQPLLNVSVHDEQTQCVC